MQKIVLYPTDTVFGLGVDATDPAALEALQELKGREVGKYFPIIVSDTQMARHYALMTPLAERLAKKFWPGKLTLVLTAQNLPAELLAPNRTVGIRVPNHPVALELVRKAGAPLTATSANVSGQRTERTVPEILVQFGSKSKKIMFNAAWPQELPPSEPSTVVDARGERPVVLREGALSHLAITEAAVVPSRGTAL